METSVLIQVPYELESAYSPLEERTDIDYTVMSVDNFNVGDFLIGLYITISSNSIITGVVSGMIWDVIKIVSHDVLDKLRQSSKEKTSEKISEQPNKEDGEQETCIKVSLCVRENSKDEYRIGAEYRINRYLNNEDSELKGKKIVYQDHPTPKERQDNIFSMFKDDIPEEMNTEEGNKVLNLILNSSEYAEDWLRYKISKGKL